MFKSHKATPIIAVSQNFEDLKLNKDADLILAKAHKESLGWTVPGPALCEELIFLAFMHLKHPLYISLSRRFSLSTTIVTNTLTSSLLQSKKDAPTEPNKAYEKSLLGLMWQGAQNDSSTAITEQNVMAALFKHHHPSNAVLNYFIENGIKTEHILKFIKDYKHVDWVAEAEAPESYRTPREEIRVSAPESKSTRWATKLSELQEVLERFGRNLTQLAKEGKLNPIFGRDAEIAAVEVILARLHQNNPILIGPPGVGKTAIVEAFAQRVATGKAPERLKDKEVWQVNMGSLIAGTTLRGQFEERVQAIMKVCEDNPRIIIYFASIHQIVGAGDSPGSSDAAGLLKPALTRGDIRCIGTTGVEAYYRYIDKDPSLARGFELIRVTEPPIKVAIEILNSVKPRYEQYHQVTILAEAIEASVELSDRYIRDRVLPGKALSLLDQACAKVSLTAQQKAVTRQVVAEVVSQATQVPVSQVLFSVEEIFQNLEERLRQRVIGQDEAIRRIAEVVQLTKYEMQLNTNRPDGVFLLAGPTGTGKTELAKALAECLLGGEQKLIRFDMSEFSEKHTVAKLIGAPPGYEGSAEGGTLTNAVKTNPYCVILFDEIEKAHSEIQRIFLQIFDDGRLTDSKGMTVHFNHSTIIMTTNLGAREVDPEEIKRLDGCHVDEYVRGKMEPAVKEFFSPEFLNRLDRILFFRPLPPPVVAKIARQKVGRILERVTTKGVSVQIAEGVYGSLSEKGFSAEYGARFLNRTIEEQLLYPLTKFLLANPQAKAVRATMSPQSTLMFDVQEVKTATC